MPDTAWFGRVAGIIILAAFIPYTRAILAGKTKPARSTWFIWVAVSSLLLVSYYEVGGGEATWLSLAYLLATIWTALLAIRHGKGGWDTIDRICFAGAGLSLSLWVLTGDPAVALFATLLVDAFGATKTIVKTWQNPEEEDSLTWCLTCSANVLNMFAVTEWDWVHGLYPAYMVAMTGTVAILSLRKSRSV
jgi:hypothetical protein